jgi:hypothetical protein
MILSTERKSHKTWTFKYKTRKQDILFVTFFFQTNSVGDLVFYHRRTNVQK